MIALLVGRALAGCTVMSGVVAHTPDGPLRGQTVVVVDDRVAALGVGLDGLQLRLDATKVAVGARWNGAECSFVQGGDRPLTPGLVAVDTQIGLVDVDLEPGARRADAEVADDVRAALYAVDAYDPLSVNVPVQRLGGITTAVLTPSGGGLVSGHAGVVQLAGDHRADAVLARAVAMAMGVPSASPAEGYRQWRELFADVRAYAADPRAYDQNRLRELFPGLSPLDVQALVPVARGERPVWVAADRAADIEGLLDLADELGLKLILRGAAEGWRVADRLAAARVPVVIDPLLHGVEGFTAQRAHEANAARLVAAGVPVAFLTGDATHNARLVRFHAGHAVRAGLDPDAALRAITAVPAEIFGLEGRGRLEVGAIADLVLWSGDPLETTTTAVQVWVAGEAVPMSSRQTELRDRYLERLGL